jgi:hypothetical protein
MKSAIVALVVNIQEGSPLLLETLTDDREINVLESAMIHGEVDPFESVLNHRMQQTKEEEEFGDYIEALLTQPFLRPDIQEHAVQWMKSKIRIEQHQKSESEAANIIAEYALKIFQDDQARRDFFLVGPSTKVRVRIFVLEKVSLMSPQAA